MWGISLGAPKNNTKVYYRTQYNVIYFSFRWMLEFKYNYNRLKKWALVSNTGELDF